MKRKRPVIKYWHKGQWNFAYLLKIGRVWTHFEKHNGKRSKCKNQFCSTM